MLKLPTKGRWLNRQEFYSICSKHITNNSECPSCQTGKWHCVYKTLLSKLVYKVFPWLWRIIANMTNSSFTKGSFTKRKAS